VRKKDKWVRVTILLASVFFTNFLIAEPKQLVCIDRDSNRQADRHQEFQEYFGETVERSSTPDKKREWQQIVDRHRRLEEKCRSASFAWKHLFTFDTDQLKNLGSTDVERQTFRCQDEFPTAVERERISTTISVISFTIESPHETLFNVDRKTLQAGFESKRDFECELQDVDTSENLI
jgi:hypothetical protein